MLISGSSSSHPSPYNTRSRNEKKRNSDSRAYMNAFLNPDFSNFKSSGNMLKFCDARIHQLDDSIDLEVSTLASSTWRVWKNRGISFFLVNGQGDTSREPQLCPMEWCQVNILIIPGMCLSCFFSKCPLLV